MADVLAVRNEYRLQSWMEIIRECEESGLSNREYCFQRGISEKTYYYWLRKVRVQIAIETGQQGHNSRTAKDAIPGQMLS